MLRLLVFTGLCVLAQTSSAALQCSALFTVSPAMGLDVLVADLASYLTERIKNKTTSRHGVNWENSREADIERASSKQEAARRLAREEMAAIRSMTGFDGQQINSRVYKDPAPSPVQLRALDALNKLPDFAGTVYRGVEGLERYKTSPASQLVLKNIFSAPGTVFTLANFWPTSKSLPVAVGFTEKGFSREAPSVLLLIHAKSAKDIEGVSQRDEREVLLLPGTTLRVVNSSNIQVPDYNGAGSYVRYFRLIELEEVR